MHDEALPPDTPGAVLVGATVTAAGAAREETGR
jgi:hypothetical protein